MRRIYWSIAYKIPRRMRIVGYIGAYRNRPWMQLQNGMYRDLETFGKAGPWEPWSIQWINRCFVLEIIGPFEVAYKTWDYHRYGTPVLGREKRFRLL